jgi:hypothetical protein
MATAILSNLPYGSYINATNCITKYISNRFFNLVWRVANLIVGQEILSRIGSHYNLVISSFCFLATIITFPFAATTTTALLFNNAIAHLIYGSLDALAVNIPVIRGILAVWMLFSPTAFVITTTNWINLLQKHVISPMFL